MKSRIIQLLTLVAIFMGACTSGQQPLSTITPIQETPIVIPTVALPENTPTAQATQTIVPAANPILPLAPGTEVTISTIRMADLSRGWAIGTAATDPNEHILFTADGGTNWKDVTPPEEMDFAGGKVATAFFQGADTAWVIYSSNVLQSPPGPATVWKTLDGGATWTPSQPIVPPGNMEFFSPGYFSFPDAQHGWLLIHGGAGMSHDYIYVYGTIDGGDTWVELVDPLNSDATGAGPSMGLWKTGMVFSDEQKGWITYENGGVAPGVTLYGTNDGGYTWATQALPAPASQPDLFSNQNYSCGLYGLAFLDATRGNMVLTCMMGSGDIKKSWFYQTTDAGQNWQSSPLPTPGGDFQMLDPKNGYYVSQKIFRTSDGGKSWLTVIPVTWSGQPVFVDMANGWLVAEKENEKALVRTKNSAVNWDILKTVISQ
jgi:photosystem II stability/assembly factor-like uncharacterized protein